MERSDLSSLGRVEAAKAAHTRALEKPIQANRRRNSTGPDSEMVVTPGGPRHRSLVHVVQPGQQVSHSQNALQILEAASGRIVKTVPPPSGASLPGLGTGWITFASWTPASAAPALSLFRTTWVVPPPPRGNSGQLLYLFNLKFPVFSLPS